MILLITLALSLAPRAHANGRLARYARNSTSHPGRCDRNVFERQFYDLAKGLKPTSDKVTAHSYETMYGQFVYPLKFAAHTPRMLEIGLGCNMDYGPGASVKARSGVRLGLRLEVAPGDPLYPRRYGASSCPTPSSGRRSSTPSASRRSWTAGAGSSVRGRSAGPWRGPSSVATPM